MIDLTVLKSNPQDFHPLRDHEHNVDVEALHDSHLFNEEVKSFAWKNIKVTVKDHKTKQIKAILDGVDGILEAGMTTMP